MDDQVKTTRRRARLRDDRDYDTTSLRAKTHGSALTRDYSAHFFRWSFARRMIKQTDAVLEIGCGVDRPLWHILFVSTAGPLADRYVGADLNALPEWNHGRSTFYGEFNFVERWKELKRKHEAFDITVCMEVIEHMKVEHGAELLRGLRELLRPGGTLLLSTPCYDGKRHAANHIHEYTVPELEAAVVKAGFRVERRFGTFMDVKHIRKASDPELRYVHDRLADYYDSNALSCIFAPLFPDRARNNLWVLRRPEARTRREVHDGHGD